MSRNIATEFILSLSSSSWDVRNALLRIERNRCLWFIVLKLTFGFDDDTLMYKVCRTILISSVRNTEIITGAMFMVSKDQVAIPVVPEKCN
jgi:hypothetical protein